MTQAQKKSRPAGRGPARGHPASIAHLDAGVAVVTVAVPEERTGSLTGSAAWARHVRRFGRLALWALPAYAVTYALVGWSGLAQWPPAPYLASGSLLYLAVGLISGWLGLVAQVGLAAVLAGTSSRNAALAGLLIGFAGAVILLTASGLPAGARPGGISAHSLVLAAAVLQTLAWVAFGVAVLQSHLLKRTDGMLLILAAPMIGLVGLFVDVVQTIGALLLLAAGLGLVRTVARLGPATPRTVTGAGATGDGAARRAAAAG